MLSFEFRPVRKVSSKLQVHFSLLAIRLPDQRPIASGSHRSGPWGVSLFQPQGWHLSNLKVCQTVYSAGFCDVSELTTNKSET